MTTRHPRSLRPVLAGALLTAFALSTAVTAGSPAHGERSSIPDGTTPEQGGPAQAGESHQVTLVTGERLVLTTLPSGEQSLTAAASADGTMPNLHAIKQHGDVYVWPADVTSLIDSFFDRELFNVSKLVEQGLADGESGSIPLIVDYRGAIAARPIPGDVQPELTLESIGAVAGAEPKASADEFGEALRAQAGADGAFAGRDVRQLTRTGPFAGIKRIYLDEQITAALADSVPQIGAPRAWEAGFDGTGVDVAVLDTGIDGAHPDLQGKVVAEANFTTRPTAADENGHGTHVASTVAGTGAASGGSRRGVAPGANLLNGRVLDQNGNGEVSWAMAAMEWAAANGADVISFSLQAGFSDGTDPFSEMVNRLTRDNGILFSIAAGNFGSGAQTVTIPGTADLALTVGAVDKQDALAPFSGRGPRLGNFAIKPDITAPGVGIVAARAAGTSLGTPVDDFYTALDGTSMATPHVSGAAAILKQEFPDFTPAQLKAALVSTAVPGPFTVYEQGGGRVDVARAFSQHVYADSAPIDFGYFPHPHDADQPVTKQLSWSNYTDAPVTLDLTVEVTGEDGIVPAEGMITLSASSVTIPTGGNASVDMTVDTRLGDPSLYGGVVRAQSADGSVVARTPVGFFKEPVRFNLTIDGFARDGRPARGISFVNVVDVNDTTAFQQTVALTDGPVTLRVPPGTYSVMGFIYTYDEPHVFAKEVVLAGDPEVGVDQDTSVLVDARPATEFIPVTDLPAEPRFWVVGCYRAGATFGSFESLNLAGAPILRAFAAPNEQVTKGDFGCRARPGELSAPAIDLSVTKPTPTDLDVTYATGSPRIDGRKKYDLVYAGYGRVQDFEGLDVRGKAVLVTRGPLPPVGDPITFQEKVDNATAAGAALVIVHNHSPGLLLISVTSEIPVFAQPKDQGEQIRALLEQRGRLPLTANGVAQSPYQYDVAFAERGRIEDTHVRTLDETTTARVDATYRSQVDSWVAGDVRHVYPPFSNFSFDGARNFRAPFNRDEFVAAGDGNRYFHVAYGSMEPFPEFVFMWEQQGLRDVFYEPGTTQSETWFGQPQHPNVIRTYTGPDIGDPVLREGNTLRGFVPAQVDPVGRWGIHDSRIDDAPFRLFENNRLIAEGQGFWNFYPLGDQPATYRAEFEFTRTAPFWALSTHTDTTWTWASAPPPSGGSQVEPLLVVDYDVGQLDVRNRSHHARQRIELHAHRQPGAAAADVTSFALWVSYDDGASWQNVRTSAVGDGRFRARVANPSAAEHVSLRVEARDSGGSRIDQTIIRAYGLA